MAFAIISIILVVVVALLIFVINPKKSEHSQKTAMFNAENSNSYEHADKRYEILNKAKINGTYLSNKKGNNLDGQEDKRI